MNTVKKPGATLVDATAGDAVRGGVSAERRDVAGGGVAMVIVCVMLRKL